MHISQIRKSAVMSVDISAKADPQPAAAIGKRQGVSDAEMIALADQIDLLGATFAEMQRQLSGLTARMRAMAPPDGRSGDSVRAAEGIPALPVGFALRDDVAPTVTPAEEKAFSAPAVRTDEPPALAAPATTPSLAEVFADAGKVDHLQDILLNYRDLIAQPVKSEINRWIAQAGGVTCEVAEDDGFYLPGGDAKGLLVLIPLAGESAIILPAGRLVVEFASHFANIIAMRAVTRHAFDLIAGDGGKMQLIEPAYATLIGNEWRLDRPGRIGGFASD